MKTTHHRAMCACGECADKRRQSALVVAKEEAEARRSAAAGSLLHGLVGLVRESVEGHWRVTLDYNNYHDGARVLDGDGKVIGECYEAWPAEMGVDDGVTWQFCRAIEQALSNAENAGGMARELAAQDSESPTKQNG